MTAIRSITADAFTGGGQRPLRLALRLDALVTGVNGLAYLAFAAPLHSLLGLDADASRIIGALLLLYGAGVALISLPARPDRIAVNAVVEANVLWTVLSIAAVAFGWFSLSTAGAVWTVLQALVVGGFAALQYTALRRTRET